MELCWSAIVYKLLYLVLSVVNSSGDSRPHSMLLTLFTLRDKDGWQRVCQILTKQIEEGMFGESKSTLDELNALIPRRNQRIHETRLLEKQAINRRTFYARKANFDARASDG